MEKNLELKEHGIRGITVIKSCDDAVAYVIDLSIVSSCDLAWLLEAIDEDMRFVKRDNILFIIVE